MSLHHEPRSSRTVIGLLVLASVTMLTLDARHDDGSTPVDPLRSLVSGLMSPVEDVASAALKPVTNIPDHFASVSDLQQQKSDLEAENARLTEQLEASDANEIRANEITGISAFADTTGATIKQAQVVAMGPAQSFSQTVTIDAGTDDGVVPDQTVVNADGLVGRVIEASTSSATVLLIVDASSTVGGRLGDSLELGFLDGDGDVSGDGRLQLSLVDHTVAPSVGDPVLTWGSRHGAPYIAGVPIGTVTSVHSSPAELTQTAQIKPYVDFSSLDVVGVVTKEGPSKQLAGGAR